MDYDIDLVDDVLAAASIAETNCRSGAKFQPKAKFKPKPTIVSHRKNDAMSSGHSAMRPSGSSTTVDFEVDDVQKLVTNYNSGLPLSANGNGSCTSLAGEAKKDMGTRNGLHSEESADAFKELTPAKDFQSQFTTATDLKTCSKAALPIDSGEVHLDNTQSGEKGEEVSSHVPGAISKDASISVKSIGNSQSLPWGEIENEFFKDVTLPDALESVSCSWAAHLISSETGNLETGPIPASAYDDMFDLSNSNSVPVGSTSEFPELNELTQLAEASYSYTVIPEVETETLLETSGRVSKKRKKSVMAEEEGREANSGEFEELSEGMHGEIPVSEACEQSESGRCLRPRRKKVAVCVLGDSIDHSSHQNGGPTSVLCNSSVVEEENNNDDDNSDYEYRAEKTHRQKSTPRRSKKVMAENERSVQKRMKNEESPKKKFSHSTQRNNRPANKVLLQTPDDEINPQELTMIDLIRLAEAKERISNKKTAASRKSLHNKSADKSLHHHEYTDSYNQGLTADDDQEVCLDQSDNYNYHTFMEKTPSKRWTKKETESFYEALPLFGANPTLLQLIFPNRTTHQLKLKLKREFHQHRIRIDDALINHSNEINSDRPLAEINSYQGVRCCCRLVKREICLMSCC